MHFSGTSAYDLCFYMDEIAFCIFPQVLEEACGSALQNHVMFNCGEFSFVLENNFRNTENSMFINYFLLGNGYTFWIAYHASFSYIVLKTIQTKSVLSVLESY